MEWLHKGCDNDLLADFLHFGASDFPSKNPFKECYKIVFFSLWRRDPVLELQFPTPLYVVGWARAEGRVTKLCFCMFYTALAPQRERIFSFFIVFPLSETSFFVFFYCFFWRGVGWGGWGVGGVGEEGP